MIVVVGESVDVELIDVVGGGVVEVAVGLIGWSHCHGFGGVAALLSIIWTRPKVRLSISHFPMKSWERARGGLKTDDS